MNTLSATEMSATASIVRRVTDDNDPVPHDSEADEEDIAADDEYRHKTVIVPKDAPLDQKRAEALLQIEASLPPAEEVVDLQFGIATPHPSRVHEQIDAKYKTRPKGGSFSGGVRVR